MMSMTDIEGIFPISDEEADALHARGWNSGYGWATEWDWWKDESSQLDSTRHDLCVALTAIRTARPLKIASRAYVNHGGGEAYDAFREDDQIDADEAMKAALLALADYDIFMTYSEIGAREINADATFNDQLNAISAFKAILRAIATEGNTDV
jgi:hypothetical protein